MIVELVARRFDDVPHQRAEIGLLAFDGQLAGLDARDVEQLADKPRQLVRLHLDRHRRAPGAHGLETSPLSNSRPSNCA